MSLPHSDLRADLPPLRRSVYLCVLVLCGLFGASRHSVWPAIAACPMAAWAMKGGESLMCFPSIGIYLGGYFD